MLAQLLGKKFTLEKRSVGFLEQLTRRKWLFGECSRTCQGLESVLFCSEVLEEGIKKRGVWLVIPLEVKKMESLVDKTPGRSFLWG